MNDERPTIEEAETLLQNLAALLNSNTGAAVSTSSLGHTETLAEPKTFIRMAEARYRTLVEQIPVVTFMAMLDGGLSDAYVSPQIQIVLGYSQAEWLENPILWYERLHPEDKSRWNAEFAKILTTGQPFDSIYRFIAKDGSTVWIRGQGKIVYDEDGKPLFIQGVGFDVTEIKKSEEAVRKSNELFSTLARVSPVGIFRTNALGQCVYVNARWCQITGTDPQAALGDGWAKSVHPDDRQRVFEKWQAAVREHQPFSMEYRFQCPDGFTPWVYGQADAEKGLSGEVVGYVGTITDITERKESEVRIQASLSEKELLLKEIHHRVKNNLQITAGLFSLQAGMIKDESVKEVFRESENRIKSMALVHEKLYQSTNLAQIDTAEYVENLASNVLRSYDAEANNIALHLDLTTVFLPIDKALPFGLILNELVANCAKHAFEPGSTGEVRISIKGDRGFFFMCIADNGRGFPQGMDFRASQSLGLKLVYMLTKQLRGSVEFNSKPGAEVRVQFPIAESN
ncbi:MAG TPA: PAS domain-containing protein [Planctomycetota bacterium]|nr:PAS domain-containing protein [Planctomycetota bacterium]